jgi:hypothetical protein
MNLLIEREIEKVLKSVSDQIDSIVGFLLLQVVFDIAIVVILAVKL